MPGQLIEKGDQAWLIRVFLGRDPITGQRQYYSESFHGRKKPAQDRLLELLRDKKRGKINRNVGTIGDLLDGLIRDYKNNGKAWEWVDGVVRKHLRDYFGSLTPSKVTFDLVQRYVEQRLATGDANATINREIALLKRSFNIVHQPLPPLPAKLREDNIRKGFVEYEQYRALLKALPEELRGVLTFGFYTGCRRGEIIGLKWHQVDLIAGIARLEPGETKNRDGRLIPIDIPELLATLKMLKAIGDREYPTCLWVFHRQGEQIRDFRWFWSKACQDVGLWDVEKQKPTRLFHDLRRSGVRNLLRSGVHQKICMTVSGHKTDSVFRRYDIVDETDLKIAGRKLGEYLKAQQAELEARERAQKQEASTNQTATGLVQ
jgi:integrase